MNVRSILIEYESWKQENDINRMYPYQMVDLYFEQCNEIDKEQ